MQLCLASIFAAIDPVVRPLRAQASASCSGRQHPAYDTALVPLHRVPQWQTRKPSHGALLPPVRSITFEEGELAPDIQAGSNVRVKADLVVYHVPKNKELQLKGWEGEVAENVVDYKGTKISANLPYKVQFIKPTEGEGKDLKFFCHLRADELETL